MTLEGLVFGGIGSIAECAEIDRKAWNAAFRSHGLDWTWSWDVYAELMREGGDRQLVTRFAAHSGQIPPVPAEVLDVTHQNIFASILGNDVPLRPGVARVMHWSARAGLSLGFVSRSGAVPIRALLQATARSRAGIAFDVAVIRDDVSHLAPHPEAMEQALGILNVGRGRVVVVADTPATAQAAQAAGLPVLAFPGLLAASEPQDFGQLPSVQVLTPEAILGAWRGSLDTAAE